jgi:hypothetical protein
MKGVQERDRGIDHSFSVAALGETLFILSIVNGNNRTKVTTKSICKKVHVTTSNTTTQSQQCISTSILIQDMVLSIEGHTGVLDLSNIVSTGCISSRNLPNEWL